MYWKVFLVDLIYSETCLRYMVQPLLFILNWRSREVVELRLRRSATSRPFFFRLNFNNPNTFSCKGLTFNYKKKLLFFRRTSLLDSKDLWFFRYLTEGFLKVSSMSSIHGIFTIYCCNQGRSLEFSQGGA